MFPDVRAGNFVIDLVLQDRRFWRAFENIVESSIAKFGEIDQRDRISFVTGNELGLLADHCLLLLFLK